MPFPWERIPICRYISSKSTFTGFDALIKRLDSFCRFHSPVSRNSRKRRRGIISPSRGNIFCIKPFLWVFRASIFWLCVLINAYMLARQSAIFCCSFNVDGNRIGNKEYSLLFIPGCPLRAEFKLTQYQYCSLERKWKRSSEFNFLASGFTRIKNPAKTSLPSFVLYL